MLFFRMLRRSSPVLNKIYTHEFNRQLYQGSLSKAVFHHYLEQDKLYLQGFATALFLAAHRFPSAAKELSFLGSYIKQSELKFHQKYLEPLTDYTFFKGIKIIQKNEAITNYTAHLLYMAEYGSLAEASASFLPCFLVYSELGKRMDLGKVNANHPYAQWISSYVSQHFIQATNRITELSLQLNDEVYCSIKQEKVITAFAKSVEFEHAFFDEVILFKAFQKDAGHFELVSHLLKLGENSH